MSTTMAQDNEMNSLIKAAAEKAAKNVFDEFAKQYNETSPFKMGRAVFPNAGEQPNPQMADAKDNAAADQKAPSRALSLVEYSRLTPEERAAMNAGRVAKTPEEQRALAVAKIEAKYGPQRPSLAGVTMDATLRKTMQESVRTAPERLKEMAKQREIAAYDKAIEDRKRAAAAQVEREAKKEAAWWEARRILEATAGERRAEESYGPPKERLDADYKLRLQQWNARNDARAALEKSQGKVIAYRTYGPPDAEPQRSRPWAGEMLRDV